jgi:hypothetical protein
MGVKHTNLARSALSASITDIATSMSVTSGDGVKFPVTSAADFFYATIVDSANIPEIVKVTTRVTDGFTVIVRAQGGTAARAWSAGATVVNFVTAESIDGKVNLSDANAFTKAQAVTPVTLATTTSLTIDASTSNNFIFTADSVTCVLQTPTTPTNGQTITLLIKQGATNGSTMTFSTSFKFPGGVVPVLSVGANAVDMLSAIYYSAQSAWYANFSKAYA